MGEGFAIDSVTLNSRDTVLITLPVGTDTFAINTIVKNYDDQYVVVRDGGLKRETEIWVYSGRAGEEAKRNDPSHRCSRAIVAIYSDRSSRGNPLRSLL